MQKVVLAGAVVLMASVLVSESGFAAKKKAAATPRSFNSCVQLALSRGFTYSDLTEGTRAQVRAFVKNCMDGKQV